MATSQIKNANLSDAPSRSWANSFRYDPATAQGHYESYYLRANHPSRPLAYWIRYTIFVPKGRPVDAIGEIWSIWFDGEADSIVGTKEEFPYSECAFDREQLKARVAESSLTENSLKGSAELGGHRLAWDLSYEGGGEPLLMFPRPLYDRGLPKAKSLVPRPGAIFSGRVEVNGVAHDIDGWRGSQNHNWGSKHTDHYAFGQVAGFDEAPESFLECATAKLKVGPLWTPPMTVIALRHEGESYALNSIGQSLKAKAHVAYFDWRFDSRSRGLEIRGRISAPVSRFVGLTYYNPPGGTKTCLNTKIASCELTLSRPGKKKVELISRHRALFEILTDDKAHGVPLLT